MACQDCDCQRPRDTEEYYNFRVRNHNQTIPRLEYLLYQTKPEKIHPSAPKFLEERIKYLKAVDLINPT